MYYMFTKATSEGSHEIIDYLCGAYCNVETEPFTLMWFIMELSS